MYLSHYGLTAKPFQITVDPTFLWLGEKHKEALAILKYGILDYKGFILLTGDIGTGKTVLINHLVMMADLKTIVATIPDPGLEILEFFNVISDAFKMNKRFDSKGDFLVHFRDFLHKAYREQRNAVLIIDEAQRLNHQLLEEIRLLSNIEKHDRKLINIFFVGQNEFMDILMEERNRAVRQRITAMYNLEPLTEEETAEYIRHRLKIAGTEKNIFEVSAVREIYLFSSGTPRLINIICDHALLTGYVNSVKKIDSDIIKECSEELRLPITGDSRQPDAVSASKEIEHSVKETMKEPISMGTEDLENKKDGFPVRDAARDDAIEDDKKQRPKTKVVYLAIAALIVAMAGYSISTLRTSTDTGSVTDSLAPQKVKDRPETEKEALTADLDKRQSMSESPPVKTPGAADKQVLIQHGNENREDLSDKQEDIDYFRTHPPVFYFEKNTNDLSDDAFQILNRVARFMSRNPEVKIIIKGYSDSTGPDSYNRSITGFRANIVRTYLIAREVNPERIQAVGLGSQDPVASNNTPEGRRLNRRVEILFNQPKSD